MSLPRRTGDVSWWYDELGHPAPQDQLGGACSADVAIVGAGFTGLWTAYYLKRCQPDLDVRVLEARTAGFGASGRNGGWLTASVTGGLEGWARTHGRQATARFQRAMNDTVTEVAAVAEREQIDAGIRIGGTLLAARNPAQLARAQAVAEHGHQWPDTGAVLLSAEEAASRVNVAGMLAGVREPHCARIDPAKLVRGLLDVVRSLGVRVHEDTPVRSIAAGSAITTRGVVRARHVLRATEGFTAALAGERRTWVPMNSSMIITDPLPEDAWAAIGWEHFDTLEDFSHVYSYAQRTLDGRIAIGGRGNPYRFGSRTDNDGQIDPAGAQTLHAILCSWFPMIRDVPVAHGWSGVLGVPRDWRASVVHDAATGLGHAGGYVGTGVAASNLAGRTLADLVLGRDTDLISLPWVGHQVRRWEPEPLRWLGIHGLYGAYRIADRREFATSAARTSIIARVADVVSGRH